MKKLLFILFFIPLVSFGQVTQSSLNLNQTNISSNTNIENELVLSDEKTTVKTALTTDLSNYTHILIVDAHLDLGYADWQMKRDYRMKMSVGNIEQMLVLSSFTIMNPLKVSKKRFKQDVNFLKSIKNKSYLYLYLNEIRGRGDDINATIIIRDYQNKIIYNATHINTGLNEILGPIIDY